MCGFVGYRNFSSKALDVGNSLHDAIESIQHRGPDDQGVYTSDRHQLGLASCRLSVIDVSSAGHQPMLSQDDDLIICFNGEIYNHRVLRSRLKAQGFRYRSTSDTETLLYAYKYWGIDFLPKLDGMFAFVLVDLKTNEMFLVRDRIGVKPLYFSLQDNVFSFSSEIKALWQFAWNEKKLSKKALYHYMTFMVAPAPYTLYQNVYKLPAGFYAKVNADNKLTFHQWYCPLDSAMSSYHSKNGIDEETCLDHIESLLLSSAKKRMMADVPVGVFLSGGLDSSLNVALMSQHTKKVRTFTTAFSDDRDNNELRWARLVAKKFGTEHHEIIISEKEAFNFYEKMVYHLDEPLSDCVCIPFYYVADLAKRHGVTVVQVGEGADELFVGYDTYLRYKYFYDYWWKPTQMIIPSTIRRYMSKGVAWMLSRRLEYEDFLHGWAQGKMPLWGGAVAFTERQKRFMLSHQFFDDEEQEDAIVRKIFPELEQSYDSYSIIDYYRKKLRSKIEHPGFYQELLFIELKQRLPELLLMRADKMSMAASLEARVPFLDYHLVEFMLQIPDHIKVQNNISKWLLKKIAKKYLPDEVINRKKVGFGAPTHRWFGKGKFFPSYFKKVYAGTRTKPFFSRAVGTVNEKCYHANPAVRAVQMWTMQNVWAQQ